MANKTYYTCDVCEADMPSPSREKYPHKGDKLNYEIQVIFTTDQTEGRYTDHYLYIDKLDICGKCLKHVLSGNYLWAQGAMGHNKYWFVE